MMTRKDYIRTAEILRNTIADARFEKAENSPELYHSLETVQFIAEQFAEFFADDNSRFDEEKFFAEIWKEN